MAEKVEKLIRGNRDWQTRRKAETLKLIEGLSSMTLEQLRQRVAARHWIIAMLHLTGLAYREIAAQLGYKRVNTVQAALQHPVVKEYLSRVRAEQERRVLEGEFGVQAAAKNAAPKVMKRIIEKAGGVEDQYTGRPIGQAMKDADLLRAGETVLRVSGDLVEKRQDLHMHILAQLSDEEMTQVAMTGRFPERFGAQLNQTLNPPTDITPED